MRLLEVPVATHDGDRAFEYAEQLDLLGVRLDPKQIELFDRVRYGPVYAMAVSAEQDPSVSYYPQPMRSLTANDEPWVWQQPWVVELSTDWHLVADDSDGWCRFPSLPGRRVIPTEDGWDDTSWGDTEVFRLWQLWPITEAERFELIDTSRDWLADNYRPYLRWWMADRGSIPNCTFAEEWAEHVHDNYLHGDVETCLEGTAAVEEFMAESFQMDTRGQLVANPPVAFHTPDADLQAAWEHLRDTCATTSSQALQAIPTWLRPRALQTERHYAPWLWSS